MSACSLSQIYLSNDIVILRGLCVTVGGADTFSILCHKQADLGLWCLLSHQSLSVSVDMLLEGQILQTPIRELL